MDDIGGAEENEMDMLVLFVQIQLTDGNLKDGDHLRAAQGL